MKIMPFYLLKTFLKILGLVLPVFVTLYLVVEFFERIDDFVERQAAMRDIVLYFLLRLPIVTVQVGAFAILLSVSITIALLERSREMIAILAAGASPMRLVQPLLLGSVVIVGMTLFAEEYILPAAHRGLVVVQARGTRPKPPSALVQQGELWYRTPDAALVHIEFVDPKTARIHGISIYRKDRSGELFELVEAREAIWMRDRWALLQGVITRFRANVVTNTEPFTQIDLAIGLEPDDLRSLFRPPSHMSLSELRSYLRKLRGRGIDMLAYIIDLHTKLAHPCKAVVMTVVGLAAMWGARNARRISLGFASTLCAGAAYGLVVAAGTALSRSQQLPLPLALWLPHLVTLGLSTWI
ncbi:MAG: LptF/LptG family permease, partial [Nitrospinae bacterium]|nr:LptF/LptG family permease [Nitrospinota bacterium]